MIHKLAASWAFLLCMISFGIQAQPHFTDEGTILQINTKHINIDDRLYSLLATTHVIKQPEQKEISLNELKSGDTVRVQLVKIAKKLYVDTIYLIPESDLLKNRLGKIFNHRGPNTHDQ